MNRRTVLLFPALAVILLAPLLTAQQLGPADRQLARSIFQEVIEINSSDSVGSTTLVAEAMRKRLLDAGFPAADLVILGPTARKGNLIVRYRGRPGSTLKPILIIGHTDVVEARREDWTTDPFKFIEKDGYFYGRGTQDMKDSDAIIVTDFIRLKKDAYVPDRDIILALTADEEGGKSNGVDWLLRNHHDLIDAEFVLNPDAGGVDLDNGKPVGMDVEATEKLYADFEITATNPGGHSSLPVPDNAIYHVANALVRLERSPFPFELNAVTRAYLEEMAKLVLAKAADIHAILQTPADTAAEARLATDPTYNAIFRTTCVATMLKGGHAPNALPAMAQANVNCRILPGHSQEEIRKKLIAIFADPSLVVKYKTDAGEVFDVAPDRKALPPPPVRADVVESLKQVVAQIFPGIPIIPEMESGASDSIYTMAAGIPSYGISGVGIDRNDFRAHGKDERLRTESFYTGVQFYYLYLKALTAK
ncbi:M20/M25/M40 family metallo-hydrolase [Granulicella arctica]|uniref:M20/M25/M40 family metallo-hydrolase n=1 Tax=Granulicella arctica TaxID=940613 RepID=UPI0021E08916|nr:M20/M25/M40 family metallo-hydrolase [Granulicella arctica]